jgi:hypothetical protein
MKHLITPSTADGAFHYYEKIVFQIYVITQEVILELFSVELLLSID